MAYPLEERIRICAAVGLLVKMGWKKTASIKYHEVDDYSVKCWRIAEPACAAAYYSPEIWLKWLAAEVHTPGTWRMKVQTRGPLAVPPSARPS